MKGTEYVSRIAAYRPESAQEESDRRLMLDFIRRYPDTVLTRGNEIAHVTSSSLILNRRLDRVLMVYHNLRDTWSWTGGHADGDGDLLAVALREAREETGAAHIWPLCEDIVSTDILVVFGHERRGRYVSAHLHLNVTYLLLCDEGDSLCIKPDENSAVKWFDAGALDGPLFSAHDRALYGKLLKKARRIAG